MNVSSIALLGDAKECLAFMHPSLPFRRCLSYPLPLSPGSARPRAWQALAAFSSVAGLILSLVLVCFRPAPALAQLVPQRQWAVFRQTDGLLSNDVHAILAVDGAIWFGTNRGVNRYDGQWRSFPISLIARDSGMQGEPAAGTVTALAKAAHGAGIWLGTDTGTLAHWNGSKWQSVTNLYTPIRTMLDAEGSLWLGTDQGLYLYNSGMLRTAADFSGDPIHAIVAGATGGSLWIGSGAGLWQLAGGQTEPEQIPVLAVDATELDARGITGLADVDPTEADVLKGPIEALWNDGAGSLWMGSGATVVQFDPKLRIGRSLEPFGEEQSPITITAITGTPGKRVWIASDDGGVAQFMFAGGLLSGASNLGSSSEGGGLDTDSVRALVIDEDNTLWFASPVGVFRYQLWAWLEPDSRLDNMAVNDLLFDRDGALWVATAGEGVQWRSGLYAHPTTYFPSDRGLPSEYVNDLEEDAAGQIWAATSGGLAVFGSGDWSQPLDNTLLPSTTVRALEADENGIWVGTSAGLAHYAPQTGELATEARFDGKPISTLARDGLGRLWVAVQSGGLWLRSLDGAWLDAQQLGAAPPAGTYATALLPDPSQDASPDGLPGGAMYVAFLDVGIYRWNGSSWDNVDRRHWTRGDRVYALALTPKNRDLWIGSDIGLSRLDALGLLTYDSHDGMENGAVRAILADPAGGFWFGGQKGLSFYEQESTPPWLQIKTVSSPSITTLADGWQVYAGQTAQAFFSTGDVQSAPDEIAVFYRLNRHGVADEWHMARSSPLTLRLETPDTVDLELIARDPSFNYSPPVVRRLAVVPPPSTVSLPLLGVLESRVFNLLLIFGALATIGFGYVSYEIFEHHHRVSEAIRRGFNPYISGEPVRREEMFYGRHELLQRIVATLHNNSIMIHGERRIGKTTLLYQLANALHQVQDDEYWFVPVLIDLEGTAEDQLFLQLIEDIYQTVITLPDLDPAAARSLQFLACHRWHVADYAASATPLFVGQNAGQVLGPYTDREFGRDLRTIVHHLEQYAAERQDKRQVRLILLLDEVDTLSQFDPLYQQQLRRIFMRDFAATLGAVVAGIAISKEWDRVESPWFNLFNEIAMAPFSHAEAVELLIEPVRGYYIYEPAALDFIVDHSGGRPYRIQQYALEAVNHMLKHKRRRIQMSDVEYAHAQILATNGPQEKTTPPGPSSSMQVQSTRDSDAPSAALASATTPI